MTCYFSVQNLHETSATPIPTLAIEMDQPNIHPPQLPFPNVFEKHLIHGKKVSSPAPPPQ